jgi:hypothetical protein
MTETIIALSSIAPVSKDNIELLILYQSIGFPVQNLLV